MSRAQGNKLYNNFSRGLITEATPLAFPENATIDEVNCDIRENGRRDRRFGLELKGEETGGAWQSPTSTRQAKGTIYDTYVWTSVGKDASLNLLVVRVDGVLYFYQIGESNQYDDTGVTLDLSSYKVSGAADSDVDSRHCEFAHGRGEHFIAHEYCEPLRVVWDTTGPSISVTSLKILIRDFIGVDDSIPVDREPSFLTAEHNYNLRNQGWVNPQSTGAGTSIDSFSLLNERYSYNFPTTTGPINDYFTQFSRYPSNAQVWWVSKDPTTGDFDAAGLVKQFFGNTRAPRGHFILEYFNKDRSAVSGIAGLTAETLTTRPRTVEFASGRVFWGYKSNVFFSPTLEDGRRAGQCFQEADPTSENISDLIATDGGQIEIPNAEEIVAIREQGDGVLVFASNGVWYVQSGSQGFSATEYSISKVSTEGTDWPRTIVRAGSQIFWWSRNGIFAIQQSIGQFGTIAGQFDSTNISDDTIKSFYNAIGDGRGKAMGVYDPSRNKVCWLYGSEYQQNITGGGSGSGSQKPSPPSSTTPTVTTYDSYYVNLLFFDLGLGAFYPYKVSQPDPDLFPSNPPSEEDYYIASAFIDLNYIADAPDFQYMQFLTHSYDTSNGYVVQPANFTSKTYTDWSGLTLSGGGLVKTTYDSYIITGYETLGDGARTKQAPIVNVFMNPIENEGSSVANGSVVYTPDCEGSLFMQARWDYYNDVVTDKKWSSNVQVYRRPNAPSNYATGVGSTRTGNPGVDVIVTRNKVRGSGRAIQFKFSESAEGKTFELLGWHVFYQSKTHP